MAGVRRLMRSRRDRPSGDRGGAGTGGERVSGVRASLASLKRAAGNLALVDLLRSGGRAGVAGPGRSIPEAPRRRLERDFGTDLGAVRIHEDPGAAARTSAAGAAATTVGGNVLLNKPLASLPPASAERLLRHEVAHVLQQTQPGLEPGTGAEAEAEARAVETAPSAAGGGVQVGATFGQPQHQPPQAAPPGRIVYLDANVFDQINRGNQAAAEALRALRTSADVRISHWTYRELVEQPAIPRTATANRLLIEDLGIRVEDPVPMARRVDLAVEATPPRGVTGLSPRDTQVVIGARAGGGELWSFDRPFVTNPRNIEVRFGVTVAPESRIAPVPAGARADYRVGRALLGLDPIEITLSGAVRRPGAGGPGGGGRGGAAGPRGGGGGGPPPPAEAAAPEGRARGVPEAPRVAAPEVPRVTEAAPAAKRAAPPTAARPPAPKPPVPKPPPSPRVRATNRAIAAALRGLRAAGGALPKALGALQAISTITSAVEFVSMATSALAGKGFILTKAIADAQAVEQGADVLAAEYSKTSTAIGDQSTALFLAPGDLGSLGDVVSQLADLQDDLTRLQDHVGDQLGRVRPALKEAEAKQKLAESILRDPKASAAIAVATFGSGELAKIFAAWQDLQRIAGSLRSAEADLAKVSSQVAEDLAFVSSWFDYLFGIGETAGVFTSVELFGTRIRVIR